METLSGVCVPDGLYRGDGLERVNAWSPRAWQELAWDAAEPFAEDGGCGHRCVQYPGEPLPPGSRLAESPWGETLVGEDEDYSTLLLIAERRVVAFISVAPCLAVAVDPGSFQAAGHDDDLYPTRRLDGAERATQCVNGLWVAERHRGQALGAGMIAAAAMTYGIDPAELAFSVPVSRAGLAGIRRFGRSWAGGEPLWFGRRPEPWPPDDAVT